MPDKTPSAAPAPLDRRAIEDLADKWAKESGWLEFERNDFFSLIESVCAMRDGQWRDAAATPAPAPAAIALRTIAEYPCPEQDGTQAANMRKIAAEALTDSGAWVGHAARLIAQAPVAGEPIGWESRFSNEREWTKCSKEHHDMVVESPQQWPGYEVRGVYTVPQATHQPALQVAPQQCPECLEQARLLGMGAEREAALQARVEQLTRAGGTAPEMADVPRRREEPAELSDERIDYIADKVVKSMPEGIRGFMKIWGWQQFARELMDVCGVRSPGMTDAEPIPSGWKFNHARQDSDGIWEIGYLDEEDDRFSPIVTVNTGLYYQAQEAEPLARAILARISDTQVTQKGGE